MIANQGFLIADPASAGVTVLEGDSDWTKDSLVIIPTYNEAENLQALVPTVLDQGPFNVLVVDDSSPDGTGELADRLAGKNRGRMSVLHRPGKMGLASAYLQGFRYGLNHRYNRLFQMDADFSHDPMSLAALRTALDKADVVLGSRYVPGGATVQWPLRRKLLSKWASRYARIVLGLPYRDLTSGYKGFRRDALETLPLRSIRSEGYAFQIEMTYRCHQLGLQIVEVPITFRDRRVGQSKISRRIIMEALLVVWQLRRQAPQRSEVKV